MSNIISDSNENKLAFSYNASNQKNDNYNKADFLNEKEGKEKNFNTILIALVFSWDLGSIVSLHRLSLFIEIHLFSNNTFYFC